MVKMIAATCLRTSYSRSICRITWDCVPHTVQTREPFAITKLWLKQIPQISSCSISMQTASMLFYGFENHFPKKLGFAKELQEATRLPFTKRYIFASLFCCLASSHLERPDATRINPETVWLMAGICFAFFLPYVYAEQLDTRKDILCRF